MGLRDVFRKVFMYVVGVPYELFFIRKKRGEENCNMLFIIGDHLVEFLVKTLGDIFIPYE